MKKYDFSRTPTTNIQRSSFDRSHNHLTTIDFGDCYPILCEEILPADTVKLRTSGFLRLSTPLHPVMSSMHVETFYFFTPLRILWDNFTKMMGVQDNPGDSTDFLIPQVVCPAGGWPEGSFEDFIGVPTQIESAGYSALYRRAASMIRNEWFRDANLQDSFPMSTGDGPDHPTSDGTSGGTFRKLIFPRGRRHDYFSSCLPSTQIGEPVPLPIGQSAPVVGKGALGGYLTNDEESVDGYLTAGSSPGGAPNLASWIGGDSWDANEIAFPFMEADLSNATGVTINQLRQAMQLQVFYERDQRGGRRWPELLKAHFQTDLPDNQYRPLFLGGGQAHVNIHPVPTTAGGSDGTAVTGELGSFGTCSFSGHGFTQSFSEHGILLGFVSARAQQLYQQGMHRQFTRKDRLDFYWSSFNQIGDEAVTNGEIYFQGDPTQDDAAFGFQERFASYRYAPSRVSGLFRSNATSGSLDAWHTADNYDSLPALNGSWITDPSGTNVDRVIATPDEPQLICDFYHKLTHVRPMPMHSTPAGIGRF